MTSKDQKALAMGCAITAGVGCVLVLLLAAVGAMVGNSNEGGNRKRAESPLPPPPPPRPADIERPNRRPSAQERREARERDQERESEQVIARHYPTIERAIRDFGFQGDFDVSLSSGGRLGVTLHLPHAPGNPERYGTDAVLAVRNALYGKADFKSFRVSLYGPPPGPDLVRVYGAARFNGQVTWHDI